MRRAGALAVAAAVAVLAAGCGGGSAASSGGSPTYAQVLALAQCMRGHGVPNFPDPNASGGYSLRSNGSIEGAGGSAIDINSHQAQTAYGRCRHLLPGGPSISQLEQMEQQEQQEQARMLPEMVKWEQCVRGHGVPNFSIGLGGQSPAPGGSDAVDPNSPQFQAAMRTCQHLLPPGGRVSISRSAQRSPS
ncbi:MAG TPA: hypothetical protein VMC03_18835 [Streptosporangiaceae bacterium]|nr:hypothetical protein [Streptosporangiaceae bacterium]